jgi:hypothetical protein
LTVGIQSSLVSVCNGRFRIEGDGVPVRVPDVVLKCVGFVGEVTHTEPDGSITGDLNATGFFVSIPLTDKPGLGPRAVYFVTAKHVASDLKNRDFYFLVNRRGGGVKNLRAVVGDWSTHPNDPTADVALIQVGNDPEADIDTVDLKWLATPERLKFLNIGIGDEVHATGLFTPVPGERRNVPIVRFGNIAMMPEEQIQTDLGFADVFLVEARSLGGISGSPVFVRPTINYKLPPEMQHGDVKNAYWCGHGATLLGLMHGHWDIRESEMNKAFFTHDRKHGVNMGIAIVVPAIKILETLNCAELVEFRERMKQQLRTRMVPGADSVKPKESTDQMLTKEDFEVVLKKASRKIAVPEKK